MDSSTTDKLAAAARLVMEEARAKLHHDFPDLDDLTLQNALHIASLESQLKLLEIARAKEDSQASILAFQAKMR